MGGSRSIAVGLGALALAALIIFLLVLRPEGATAQGANSGTYVGVASCGGTTCHGRSEADGPVVRQDEIMLWQDPSTAAGAHSRAYDALRDPGLGRRTTRRCAWAATPLPPARAVPVSS
jgi:hypothetical protein